MDSRGYNSMNESDTELVHRARSGDETAFEEIDRRYRSVLLMFLLRFVRSQELAEELTQQTLVRAYEMIGQLRDENRLAPWLHRIAFRLAAAEGRRRKNVSLEEVETEITAPAYADTLIEAEQTRNLWETARQALSEEEFLVLRLRYREDRPLAAIAEETGKSEGAVRVQLHRIRKKLLPYMRGG